MFENTVRDQWYVTGTAGPGIWKDTVLCPLVAILEYKGLMGSQENGGYLSVWNLGSSTKVSDIFRHVVRSCSMAFIPAGFVVFGSEKITLLRSAWFASALMTKSGAGKGQPSRDCGGVVVDASVQGHCCIWYNHYNVVAFWGHFSEVVHAEGKHVYLLWDIAWPKLRTVCHFPEDGLNACK